MYKPNTSTAWRLDHSGSEIKQVEVCQEAYDDDVSTYALINNGLPSGKDKFEIVWFYNLDLTQVVDQVTIKLRATSSLYDPPELTVRSYYPLPADNDPLNDPGDVLGRAVIPVVANPVIKVIKIPKTRICDLRITFRATLHVNVDVYVYDIGYGGVGGLGSTVFFIL